MPYAANGHISQSPIDGGVDISDDQYLSALQGIVLGKVVRIDNGFSVSYPEPYEEPDPLTPDEELAKWRDSAIVSRRQAKQQLVITSLLSQVQPAIDAIANEAERDMVQIYWDDAQTFERNHPNLIELSYSLGLSDDQIDSLFMEAKKL